MSCASFNQTTHLKQHIRTHTSEWPYKCEVCSAAFNRTSIIKRHAHSAFSKTSHLKSHSRYPHWWMTIKCEECCDTCGEIRYLNKHMHIRTHTHIFCGYHYHHKIWLIYFKLVYVCGAIYYCQHLILKHETLSNYTKIIPIFRNARLISWCAVNDNNQFCIIVIFVNMLTVWKDIDVVHHKFDT